VTLVVNSIVRAIIPFGMVMLDFFLRTGVKVEERGLYLWFEFPILSKGVADLN